MAYMFFRNADKTYQIFVSHAWKYSDSYNTVIRWLEDAKSNGDIKYRNYSVPEHDPVDANNINCNSKSDSQAKKLCSR